MKKTSTTNSKVSRVQPVFGWLNKNAGNNWADAFLKIASGLEFPRKAGLLQCIHLDPELKVPASSDRLEWMIRNTKLLAPADGKRWQGYENRLANSKLTEAALLQLSLGKTTGVNKKLIFEGKTNADCVLECEHSIIWVEGKRFDWLAAENIMLKNTVTNCGVQITEFNKAVKTLTDQNQELSLQLKRRNVMAAFIASETSQYRRQDLNKDSKVPTDSRTRENESVAEKNSPASNVPPAAPKEHYICFNVQTGTAVCSGSSAELTQYYRAKPAEVSLLMTVNVSMLPQSEIDQLVNDPTPSRKFIDSKLQTNGNSPELPRLLLARFPNLEEKFVLKTAAHMKAFAFGSLLDIEKKNLANAKLESALTR